MDSEAGTTHGSKRRDFAKGIEAFRSHAMKMPHDATHISQLDLSDSDREDANHGKQLTICWMVHCVHDHALCQTQYYCFI